MLCQCRDIEYLEQIVIRWTKHECEQYKNRIYNLLEFTILLCVCLMNRFDTTSAIKRASIGAKHLIIIRDYHSYFSYCSHSLNLHRHSGRMEANHCTFSIQFIPKPLHNDFVLMPTHYIDVFVNSDFAHSFTISHASV